MNTLPDTARRRKLPIGMQTLAHLRGDGCYYVGFVAQPTQPAGGRAVR